MGRPRTDFRKRVLARAEEINQRYEDDTKDLLYPHDVIEFLDFDTLLADGRKPDFDRIKQSLYLNADCSVQLKVDPLVVRLGSAKVNLEPELADRDLLSIRVTLTPDLRKYIPHLTTKVKPLKDLTLENTLKEFLNTPARKQHFKSLSADDQQLLRDCNEILFRARHKLITRICSEMDTERMDQMRSENQAKALVATKNAVNLKLNSEVGVFAVGGFPLVMLMLLEQIGLVSELIAEWGAKLAGDILEFAFLCTLQDNYRPSRAKHIEYARGNLSLTRKPFDSYFYTNTFVEFTKTYLNTPEAAAKGLVLDGNSIIKSYVLINQKLFALQKNKEPRLLMDGTSIYCKSKHIDLVDVGHFGATGQITDNIKEFTIYEHTTGLILYHAFAAGNTNDFIKTANALRSDITKSLAYKVDFSQLTFVGDRGCCSEEIVAILLNWNCQFVLFTKGDSNKMKKIREQAVADYVATYDSSALFSDLKSSPTREEVNYATQNIASARRLTRPNHAAMVKLVSAQDIGACTFTGRMKSGNAFAVDKAAERDARINPDAQLLVTLFFPRDIHLKHGAIQYEWYKAHDKLYQINDAKETPPKMNQLGYYQAYTLNDLIRMTPMQAYAASISNIVMEVKDEFHKHTEQEREAWKLEYVKKGVSYRHAQTVTEADGEILRAREDADWLDQPFCYGINKKKFLEQPFKSVYRMMISRFHVDYDQNNDQRAYEQMLDAGQKSLYVYGDRNYIEINYKGHKRLDGSSVRMSSIHSYSIRKVTIFIARLLRHLIRMRYYERFKRNLNKKNKNSLVHVPSMSEIQDLLNGLQIDVNYKDGTAQIRNANALGTPAKELLDILRVEEPNDEHLYAYLKLFWNRNVKVNGITLLSMPSVSRKQAEIIDVSNDISVDDDESVEDLEDNLDQLYDVAIKRAEEQVNAMVDISEEEREGIRLEYFSKFFDELYEEKKDESSKRRNQTDAYSTVDLDQSEISDDADFPGHSSRRTYSKASDIEYFDEIVPGKGKVIKDRIVGDAKKSSDFKKETKGMTREQKRRYFAAVGRKCSELD